MVGSRAYGLETEESDKDVRGCFLPPAELDWSLHKVSEQIVDEQAQECYWEFEKLLRLGLRSNPNALECLNSPIIEYAAPIAEELLSIRDAFPSRLASSSYLGYADAQFTRLKNKEGASLEPNWKHAMHLIRLMLSGLHLLRTGEVLVNVAEYRDLLLSIKRGQVPWQEVEERRIELRRDMEVAAKQSPLPKEPDVERVDGLLIRARRSMVKS